MSSLHAVIMAGGAGTRFWPASRAVRPKQFLPLARGQSLLAATVERLSGLCDRDHVWIVTNRTQADQLAGLLPHFPQQQVIVEPEPRDTAPCVALATAVVAARDPHATMVVLPADHVIEPVAEFHRMVRRGEAIAADASMLVTFGVEPTFPATGFGYIECGEKLDRARPAAFLARRFCEKPKLALAKRFVAERRFLWNSGIFVWTVPSIRAAIAAADAKLARCTESMCEAVARGDAEACARAFRSAPKTSIDYAVLEKAKRVAVVAATVRWNDVGSFPAIASIVEGDAAKNVALLAGGATHTALQSKGNVVYAEGKRLVALFGVKDLVVVAVGDAVLVCPKDRAADLKSLVEHLRAEGRTDVL